jgi:LEA14-like dessication related protein
MLKYIFILGFCVLLVNCNNIKEIQCTGIKGFKINKIGMDGIDGDLILSLKNPNPYAFSIYKSEFDVTYSGIYLGKARLNKNVRIHRNAEENYSFNLKKEFKDVSLVDVMKLLNGASFKNSIEIKGELKAGRFFLKKKIPVDVKEKLGLN